MSIERLKSSLCTQTHDLFLKRKVSNTKPPLWFTFVGLTRDNYIDQMACFNIMRQWSTIMRYLSFIVQVVELFIPCHDVETTYNFLV